MAVCCSWGMRISLGPQHGKGAASLCSHVRGLPPHENEQFSPEERPHSKVRRDGALAGRPHSNVRRDGTLEERPHSKVGRAGIHVERPHSTVPSVRVPWQLVVVENHRLGYSSWQLVFIGGLGHSFGPSAAKERTVRHELTIVCTTCPLKNEKLSVEERSHTKVRRDGRTPSL